MNKYDKIVTLYITIIALSGLIFGLDLGIIAGAAKYIKSQFNLTSLQIGMVVSAAGLGVNIALFFTASAVSYFGRKKTMIFISILYLLSAVLSTFAVNYWSLVIARVLGGMGFVSLGITSMYIGEIAPKNIRGKGVSAMQLFIGVGVSVAYIISYKFLSAQTKDLESARVSLFLSDNYIWRWMFACTIIPCLLWLCSLFILPESPRWLMLKGRNEEAKQILYKLNDKKEANYIYKEIYNSIHNNIKTGVFEQLSKLFTKRMKTIIILGFGLAITQSLAGMGIISYYSPLIFEQAGLGAENASFQTVIVGLLGIVGSFLTILFIEKVGRKPLYVIGALAILISHLSIGYGLKSMHYSITPDGIEKISQQDKEINIEPLKQKIGTNFSTSKEFKDYLKTQYSNKELAIKEGIFIKIFAQFTITPKLIVAAVFLFKLAFFLSIGPLQWVMFSEIMPNTIRSTAIPFFSIVGSFVAWLTQRFFPWQLEVFGGANTFLFYAGLAIVSLIFIIVFVPETKGRSIEELEKQLTKEEK